MEAGSVLEREIGIDVPLLCQADGNILHLQFESLGGRSPGIPRPASLAEHIQNVGRVGAVTGFPIPALLQQHPD